MLSRSSRVAIASFAASGCLATHTWAQTPKLPVAVERASISKDTRLPDYNTVDLNVDLVNNGSKTVTAWAYWIELRLDDGTTRRIPGTSDALPATEPENYVLAAKGRRTDTQSLPDVRPATITDVSVQISAVIFDDATAAGNERLLSSLFARRSQYLETWNALSMILSVARARYSDPSMVLEKLKEDLDAADPKIRATGDWRLIRQRVIAAIQRADAGGARSALSALARHVDSHRESFQAQATRRPNQ
jgi:hypothetical protein